MKNNSVNLKKLFLEKKYSQIISIIENDINESDQNSGLLNLSGVCKNLLGNDIEIIKSSQEDFRKAYLKEKNTPNAIHALKNFINVSMDIYDLETRLGKNQNDKIFKEILEYFENNKDLFLTSESHAKSILRVFKRNLDFNNIFYFLKNIIKLNNKDVDAICSYIYFNNFISKWSQKDFFEYVKILNKNIQQYALEQFNVISDNKGPKINLAFLTSDIRGHHSVTYFLKSVLLNYDRAKFNIFLYLNNKKEDETLINFKKYFFRIKNIFNLSDVEAINLIRKDKIDVIIDLMGLTSTNRLAIFKNRVAKKQVLWCGYNNTTGIEEMDYLISDYNCIFESEQKFYSEKIIYLKKIWNCHAGFPFARKYNKLPYDTNKYITFGSFNNFKKINDDVINTWSSILKKIPDSKLILKTSDPASLSTIFNKFEKKGVLESIKFQPFKKKIEDHLKDYNKIDIALDTFPYNGVTTSFEAIWMGVPVLTMSGNNFNSRTGESINRNLNLDELICKDQNEYIVKASSLATDINKIRYLRHLVFSESLNSPLFNKKEFSDEFFSALQRLIA